MKRSIRSAIRQASPAPAWDLDRVFVSGDEFFSALETALDTASDSIDMESYIWGNDVTGSRIFSALERAASRGVRIRIIVDGIGSAGWGRAFGARARGAGIPFKIFHALPWERSWSAARPGSRRSRLARFISRLNNRNHRKLCIIDHRRAFVGSMNVVDDHVAAIRGGGAWRDTGALVEGPDVTVLEQSFEHIWLGSFARLRQRLRKRGRRLQSSDLVRLNVRSRQRQTNYADLLNRIRNAQRRVWITNAYFVPDRSLLDALEDSARRGADVRVLLPRFTDVFFIPWVASALQYGLLKAGVKVFEYTKSILHAKTIVADDWILVGSSNLNHRSLFHDLEADVVLTGEESRASMVRQFEEDTRASEEVTEMSWLQRPALSRLAGRLLLVFRYLM